MKIQFPSRSELPKLPTLQGVSDKFNSAKNAVVEKFQSNKWMNGESILEFAKENKAELGAIGAAAAVSTLAIYSIIPGSSGIVDGNNTTDANLTNEVNNTTEKLNNQTGALDYISNFSSLTSTGTLTVAGLAVITAIWFCCCPKNCASKCARSKPAETQAQKEARLKDAKDAKEVEDFSALMNKTDTSKDYKSAAVQQLDLFGKTTEARQELCNKLAAAANDSDALISVLENNLTKKENNLLGVIVSLYTQTAQTRDETLECVSTIDSLTECFFKDVTKSTSGVDSNEVTQAILDALAPKKAEETKVRGEREGEEKTPLTTPPASPTITSLSSSSADQPNMLTKRAAEVDQQPTIEVPVVTSNKAPDRENEALSDEESQDTSNPSTGTKRLTHETE